MADTTSIGGNSVQQLKSYVDRIERVNEEIKSLGEDRKDLYTEVKSAGFTPKIVRKMIARRAMEKAKREEEDALLETYEGAVGL
jgi:uncharacterized protein (UPF0335 family)